jgi:acyl-CoA oxidase
MQKEIYSPQILQYIPFFYIIWSDDLLSASEINVVEKSIQEDDTLTKNDRHILHQWLNVKNPPKDELFKSWKQIISNSGIKLVEHETYPLATLSQKLASHYHDDFPFSDYLKNIEINLGIQPNHYNHLFDVQIPIDQNSLQYDASIIDKLLKG